MERMTISLDDELAAQFDAYLEAKGYKNRSECMRDLIREKLEQERLDTRDQGHCVGTLTYVFNHHERELSRRLTQAQHHHHDIAISTLHVHLDHDHCMETVVLSGQVKSVQEFADSVIARPGVRHGRLYLVPVDMEQGEHHHGPHTGIHSHARPQT
jgi:CopG family nickel-responsive transcriptional regulator